MFIVKCSRLRELRLIAGAVNGEVANGDMAAGTGMRCHGGIFLDDSRLRGRGSALDRFRSESR